MHRLQPILEETLGKKMVLPERKLDYIEAFLERFPGVERVMMGQNVRFNDLKTLNPYGVTEGLESGLDEGKCP